MVLKEEGGLLLARIDRRYKRFLADVVLEDGTAAVAHCVNTGTMRSCWEPGDPVLLRCHDDPKRKLPYTLVACRRDKAWVGVDTAVPNALAFAAAARDLLPGVPALHDLRREVRYGHENSRVDLHGLDPERRSWFIEVKNTTLKEGRRVSFPDAVSVRGAKHLRELQAMVEEGHAAVILFLVQRGDVDRFDAARGVDPVYARALDLAAAAGVRVLPLQVALAAEPGAAGSWTLRWSLLGELPWERVQCS
ncbi:MAG: DNA/RNA nuclease SfsA [Holophagaceae bacterium]|nr:DNA/RNA nuclease SfsA [Holophagaceae bacterium]